LSKLDGLTCHTHHHGELQNQLSALFPYPLPPAAQGRRVDRKSMPEMLLAAEILMVRIFHPPPNRLLIRGDEGAAQLRQPHHHADRDARTAFLRVQLAEFPLKRVPVNQSAQPAQEVTMVQNVCQAAAEHVQLRACCLLLWLHRKSPEIEGQSCCILQFIVMYFSDFIM
ncbi:MAG: hypothetical protein FWF31_09060, partial [Desulfobulbus sp.]|nr:hypothetical protein [Desulfobulbus sp.]